MCLVGNNLHIFGCPSLSSQHGLRAYLTTCGARIARHIRIQGSGACGHAGRQTRWRRRGCSCWGCRSGCGRCGCGVRLCLLGLGLSCHVVRLAVLQFRPVEGLFALLGIEIPNSDGIAGSVSGLYFVRVTFVRPEEYQAVEFRFNVRNSGARRGSNSVGCISEFSLFLFECFVYENLPQDAAAFPRVPVYVQVIDGRYDPSIFVGIVHVHDVVCPGAGVACHHSLRI